MKVRDILYLLDESDWDEEDVPNLVVSFIINASGEELFELLEGLDTSAGGLSVIKNILDFRGADLLRYVLDESQEARLQEIIRDNKLSINRLRKILQTDRFKQDERLTLIDLIIDSLQES